MIWLLGGYLWLYVHRPFEVWPALGTLQIERGYMLMLLLAWLVTPTKSFPMNRAHLGMALFALALLITWLASPYADLPGSSEVVENYFKVAVFYVLVITTVNDERSLRKLLYFFLGSVSIYALHSLWEYVGGRYEWRMGTARMVGVDITYRDPNAFAASLLLPLVLSLVFWREVPRQASKFLLLACGGLFALCIMLTGSRTGFLGLCLLMTALPLLFMKQKLAAVGLILLGGMVGVGIMMVALPPDLQDRYLTILDSSRGPQNAVESAQGRIQGITVGLQLWQASPLVGHGPGSFPIASGLELQPHNLYGQVLSEMGLVGAVALLLVVACFALNLRETFVIARQQEGQLDVRGSLPFQVSLVVGLCVILMLLLGLAGHNLYRYHWQWLTAFQVAALTCLRNQPSLACEPATDLRWQPV